MPVKIQSVAIDQIKKELETLIDGCREPGEMTEKKNKKRKETQ
jgi:hypothetical protein